MAMHTQEQPSLQPPQHQNRRPGVEAKMTPRPKAEDPGYRGNGKLRDRGSACRREQ